MKTLETLKKYLLLMLKEVEGPKILLLDDFTSNLISLVFSHSQILSLDVLVVDKLQSVSTRTSIKSVSCVIFLQPQPQHIDSLRNEISLNKFSSYYVYFTNFLDQRYLHTIAEIDKHKKIKCLKELYCDYLTLDEYVFTLHACNDVTQLYFHHDETGLSDKIVWSLISVIISQFKEKPFIRYQKNSSVLLDLAKDVLNILSNNSRIDRFFENSSNFSGSVLILCDRRNDAITPLLHQWTYQAMVNELVGISKNIIKVDQEEVLFSSLFDVFMDENKFKNWGDLCIQIKELVDKYKRTVNDHVGVESIEDIKKFINSYDQFTKMNKTVNDHINIVSKLKNVIKARNLLGISKVEQEIVCDNNLIEKSGNKENFKSIMALVKQKKFKYKNDLIKLVLIYLLRYESTKDKDDLTKNNIKALFNYIKNDDKDDINKSEENHKFLKKMKRQINAILSYGGKRFRGKDSLLFKHSEDVSNNGGSVKKGLKAIFRRVKSAIKDVDNVYTQHDPLIKTIIESSVKGTLPEDSFPFYSLTCSNFKPKKIVLFVVGGITYEETRLVHLINRKYKKIGNGVELVLGGTHMLNSKSFMRGVESYLKEKNDRRHDDYY